MSVRNGLIWLGVSVALLAPPTRADETKPREAVAARHGMVVCVSPEAADVGVAILQRGGNAVDAAVAVAFAQAVTYPAAGNIGGGGFMLIHPAPGQGAPTMIEYRETAPAAATPTLFAHGRDSYDHKIVGVPGTVRGMHMAFEKYGSKKLTWADLVAPAVKLATDGFAVEGALARQLNAELKRYPKHAEFQRVYGHPGGTPWKAGDVLKQPDLAATLRLIAQDGAEAFYSGRIADQIVDEMKRGGGLLTHDDLKNYKAVERKPIHGTYRGYDVYAPSPPSAGGTVLVESLNMLENFDVKSLGAESVADRHLLAEVMRRAYLDRYRYLADPDFVAIPPHLTSKEYAKQLASGIDMKKATPSLSLAPDIKVVGESENTTHFSIVDPAGMAVANTYTLEDSYGSHIVVRGAGFLLNNEMNDFNPVPGVTKADGQIGTTPNLIAPGKRMLSSQTPTILVKDGKIVLVTGSPGGRTITNTVLQVIVNVIDHGMSVQAAVDAPRIHHAWLPDEIRIERAGAHAELMEGLKALGHKVAVHRAGKQGDAHTIWIDPATGIRYGAADRRLIGKAAGY